MINGGGVIAVIGGADVGLCVGRFVSCYLSVGYVALPSAATAMTPMTPMTAAYFYFSGAGGSMANCLYFV